MVPRWFSALHIKADYLGKFFYKSYLYASLWNVMVFKVYFITLPKPCAEGATLMMM